MTIAQPRLSGVQANIADPNATQFTSRKAAARPGNSRRALDIIRSVVKIVEYSSKKGDKQARSSPSRRQGGGIPTHHVAAASSKLVGD